jgi:hypothetical protein
VLSPGDVLSGPPWIVVGCRPSGERLALRHAHTLALACRWRERFECQLRDYAEIRVELVGGDYPED